MARLEAACERAVKAEGFIEGMKRVAQPILYRNRAEFAAFSRAESENFRSELSMAKNAYSISELELSMAEWQRLGQSMGR